MKKQNAVLILLMIFGALAVVMGIMAASYRIQHAPRPGFTIDTLNARGWPDSTIVFMPEECRLIKPTDILKGYWVDGVLHIEFNNKNNQ